MFDANQSRKAAEAARKEAKTSVFSSPAVDDLIDRQIQAQVHSKEKQLAGVHFGPLPNAYENDEQNTAC